MIAADCAPGLLRAESGGGFGFLRWRGRDEAAWRELLKEARERRTAGLSRLRAAAPGQTIAGRDHDPRAVRVALDCVRRAGLSAVVTIAQGELSALRAPAARRARDRQRRPTASGSAGARTPRPSRVCSASACAPASPAGARRCSPGAARRPTLSASRSNARPTLHNGPIECTLAYYDVGTGARCPRRARRPRRTRPPRPAERAPPSAPRRATAAIRGRRPPTRGSLQALPRPPKPGVKRPARPRPRARPLRTDTPPAAPACSAAAPSSSPTGCARTSAGSAVSCAATASPATASTTPTCPTSTWSSTCTATGSTCRSTRRRRRSTSTRSGGGSTTPSA